MKAIQQEHLKQLRPLEAKLKQAVKLQETQVAEVVMQAIQLLAPYGSNHHRLLECRLWYFESQFDANYIATAESGFKGIHPVLVLVHDCSSKLHSFLACAISDRNNR